MDDTKMKYFVKIILSFLILTNYLFADTSDVKISGNLLDRNQFSNLSKNFSKVSTSAGLVSKNKIKKKKIKFRGTVQSKRLYKKYAPSVVYILNPNLESLGTGSVINNNGLVLTNWHVVQNADVLGIWIKSDDPNFLKNEDYFVGKIIKQDKKADLAILQVTGLPKDIVPISIGSVSSVEEGDEVFAIGHPEGYTWSFTTGIVSKIRKNFSWQYKNSYKHSATLIQTQTPISPGNSGGPLLDFRGRLVGVNTSSAGSNINFAVGVNHVKKLLSKKAELKKENPLNTYVLKKYPNARMDDYNNNGVTDTWYVDVNKNGKIDTAFVDDDEDGFIEATLIDDNENGIWEIQAIDDDLNGKPDRAFLDQNEDKKIDVIAYDYDQDGKWDEFKKQS